MFAKWHVPPQLNFSQPQEIKPHWVKRLEGYLPARDGTGKAAPDPTGIPRGCAWGMKPDRTTAW